MTNDRKDPASQQKDGLPTVGIPKARPPLGRRFQPGRSGNPLGRPRGARNRAQVVKTVMAEVHEVGVGSRRRKLTTLELVLLRLRQRALSGDRDAVRTYHRYLETYDPQ